MNARIEDLMVSPVITTRPHKSVEHVRNIMKKNGVNSVPIVDGDNQLEGIVSSTDMLEDLSDHPLVAGHRSGIGLLGAVVLDPDRLASDPDFHYGTYLAIREAGLISRAIGGDALQLSPPLIVTESDIEEMGALLRAGLDAVA